MYILEKLKSNAFYITFFLIVCLLGTTISIFFYIKLNNQIKEETNTKFQSLFERKVNLIKGEVDKNLNILKYLKSFSNASDNIDREKFKKFVELFLNNKDYEGLYAIS